MQLKYKLSDYTEQEFLAFLHEIERANEDEPEEVLSPLLMHFRNVTEHPSGINLIYRAATEEDGELEQIIRIVKEWRLANGKDSFKNS